MEFRCRACGFRSFNAGMFVETSGRGRRCVACGPVKSPLGQALLFLTCLILALLLLSWALFHDESMAPGFMWLFAAALYPAAFVTSVTHELGHAAATWLVGGRVHRIKIGSGPHIWRSRGQAFEFQIGANPLWGGQIAHVYEESAGRRWKEAVILSGGVAANAIAAIALCAFAGWLEDHLPLTTAVVIVMALAASQAIAVVLNLWPHKVRRAEGLFASDGARLLMLPRDTGFPERAALAGALYSVGALLKENRKAEALSEARRAWLRLGGGHLFSCLVDCTGKAVGPEAAMTLYFDHADRIPDAQDFDIEWAHAMANLAWHAALAERPDWLELADGLSARAFELSPEGPIKATRGGILMLKGETDTGERMIRAGIPGCAEARDKAGFCDFLARHRPATDDYLAAEYARLSRHLAAAA